MFAQAGEGQSGSLRLFVQCSVLAVMFAEVRGLCNRWLMLSISMADDKHLLTLAEVEMPGGVGLVPRVTCKRASRVAGVGGIRAALKFYWTGYPQFASRLPH